MIQTVSMRIGDEELILETGRIAKQANGAVFAKYAGSAVLATACAGREVEGLDFVALQVEYNEKYYAAGKIPGGFLKREGRLKDKEILVCRLIDRPMRPLFTKSFNREIQVIPTVVSTDQINPPDIIAMIAASAAVTLSDIPFSGPVGAVRIAAIGEELVINPTFQQIKDSRLDIIVAGTKDGITMVEGGGKQVSEELMLKAIEKAESVIKDICDLQLKLAGIVGKEKLPINEDVKEFPLTSAVKEYAYAKLEDACFVKGKFERGNAVSAIKKETLLHFEEQMEDSDKQLFGKCFEDMEKEIVRKSILEKGIRTDGRGVDNIRPITCELDILPRTHGSALFTRGETQALVVTTLGTTSDELMIDDIDSAKSYENFMLHYNFPPFSVGETGRMGTGRREIGHGHLAFRAIQGVLPSKESFPYTVRVVSEVTESNGSSSMATVCGSSLSLLGAGVPLEKPVAGIAMGLISSPEKTVVLSDILGEEDHLGDMDFKVAGTEDGITAFQMDIKISGVTVEIMKTALDQAKRGRMHILGVMAETISRPSDVISEFAPKIMTTQVDEDKIGLIIGPGGKNIKGISEKTGASINIENDGKVTIFGKDKQSAQSAFEMIRSMVEEPEIGRIYEGTVKRIMDFGAFIEILPGKEGLCHISKLSRKRVEKVSDVLQVDQQIPVKIVEIDRMNRINLSYIDALEAQKE